MQSQQEAQQEPGEALVVPRGDPKLKSERVQWRLQLPERMRRKIRQATEGRMQFGEVITVTVDFTELIEGDPEDGTLATEGSSKTVEAGPASGTPDHNRQPTTQGKEEDHARI